MSNQLLATYLNDHLAGANVALGLLGSLETEHAGTPIASLASDLKLQIGEELPGLTELLTRIGTTQSLPRNTLGWLAEKLADLKLRIDDPQGRGLRLLEMFEALSLGIEGKHSLWRALEAASDRNPALRTMDYADLKKRAEEQRRRVEVFRLESASKAFGSGPNE